MIVTSTYKVDLENEREKIGGDEFEEDKVPNVQV
jgi:hypothetical protein